MTRTTALVSLLLAPWLLAAKPKPSPTATAAVTSGERRLVEGSASFRLGKQALTLKDVGGSLQTSSGFQIASLVFTGEKKQRLQIDFMYLAPGPLDPSMLTGLYASDEDGRISAFKKGIASCSINLAKATPDEVEGTASCPKGMLDLQDKPAKPITAIEFHATTQRSPDAP